MSSYCLPSTVRSLLHSFSLNSHCCSGVCCYPRLLMRRASLARPLRFLVCRSQPAKLGLDPSCLSLCVEHTGKASLIVLKPLQCWSYCSLLHVEASRFLKINQSSTGCPGTPAQADEGEGERAHAAPALLPGAGCCAGC